MQSIVTVPLYDTLGPDVVEFISNEGPYISRPVRVCMLVRMDVRM